MSVCGPKARLVADLICFKKAAGMAIGTNTELGLPNADDILSLYVSKLTPPLRVNTVPMMEVMGNDKRPCAMLSWNLVLG